MLKSNIHSYHLSLFWFCIKVLLENVWPQKPYPIIIFWKFLEFNCISLWQAEEEVANLKRHVYLLETKAFDEVRIEKKLENLNIQEEDSYQKWNNFES